MADDIDMWTMGDDGMLPYLAGSYRMGAATGPNAGDVFPASLLFHKDATGRFVAQGGGVNGAGLIDVTYGAPGASITALRATLNSGAGGAYWGGYSAEAHFAHNCEFISGSGWVARHTDAARYTQSGGVHTWYGNTGLTAGSAFTPTERMRIAANGNVGIGTAAPSAKFVVSNAGASGLEINPSGGIGDGPTIIGYNRATSAYVSVTSYAASQSFFCGTGAAIRALEIDANGDVYSGVDNLKKLGLASNRWSVAYFGSNPIVTCDVRFKTYRAEAGPTEAELRAALRCVAELGFFQSNDAIAEKGVEDARWHFGPRAQAVWMHWADEELCDALVEDTDTGALLPPEGSIPPAFLCFDEWDEETAPVVEEVEIPAVIDDEGNEIEPARIEQHPTGETYVTRPAGNRFGVRIDQLHSLMIAALNAERLAQAATAEAQAATIASMEARLTALEAAA